MSLQCFLIYRLPPPHFLKTINFILAVEKKTQHLAICCLEFPIVWVFFKGLEFD